MMQNVFVLHTLEVPYLKNNNNMIFYYKYIFNIIDLDPSIAWCKEALRAWGYKVGPPEGDEMDKDTQSAIIAFQQHYRPMNYDGVVDVETCDILESLLIEYDVKF